MPVEELGMTKCVRILMDKYISPYEFFGIHTRKVRGGENDGS